MFKFLKKNETQEPESYRSFGTGKVIPLEEVEDPVFSQKMMGDGYALDITKGQLFAPISGTVTMAFPTGHALGIEDKDGVEVLLHFGIDTVQLEGKGFNTVVKQGDKVKQGQLISTMDLALIQSEGKSTVSMLIFTSGQKIELLKAHQEVTNNEKDLFRFI